MQQYITPIELMDTEHHHLVKWDGGHQHGSWTYNEKTEELTIVFAARPVDSLKTHVFRRVPSTRTWILHDGKHNNKAFVTVLLIQTE